MAKLQVILIAAALSLLAVSQAQQQRYSQRLSRGRSRYSARQELAPADAADPDAVTPYPSADELKPEVPFDEAAAPRPPSPHRMPSMDRPMLLLTAFPTRSTAHRT